jgi:hypothetical protein
VRHPTRNSFEGAESPADDMLDNANRKSKLIAVTMEEN